MTRGQRGRRLARIELVIGAAVVLAGPFMWIARPGFMGPEWQVLGISMDDMALGVGLAIGLAGLAWMVRIRYADPEPDQPWRYRARDR